MEPKNSDNEKIRHWADALNDLCPKAEDDVGLGALGQRAGPRFQEARLYNDECLAVGLYQRGLIWLVLDLNNQNPSLFTVDDPKELKKRETKNHCRSFFRRIFAERRLFQQKFRPNLVGFCG
jgi:hypothetical protein